jgi:hypothetical protein
VADYLYQPNAEHARVAGEAEITSLIEFTTDAEDDPDAPLRMTFQNTDIPATRLDGALKTWKCRRPMTPRRMGLETYQWRRRGLERPSRPGDCGWLLERRAL